VNEATSPYSGLSFFLSKQLLFVVAYLVPPQSFVHQALLVDLFMGQLGLKLNLAVR